MVFKAGVSGNPLGRPKGVQDRRSILLELIEPHCSQLIAKAIEMALEGNEQMLKLFLDRILPPKPREESIAIHLEEKGFMDQAGEVIQQLSDGNITPMMANTLLQTIALEGKVFRAEELRTRIEKAKGSNHLVQRG